MSDKYILVQEKKKNWVSRTNSEFYEDEMGNYAKNRDKEVVERFLHKNKKTELALDMPCGAGRFGSFLREQGFRVIGADYNEMMLKTTRKRTNNPVVRCDAFHLPFRKNSFDNILTLRLIFHYPNPDVILSQLSMSLKKSGTLVFDTLNKFSLRYFFQFPLNIYRRNIGMRLYFFTRKKMRKVLAENGLKVVGVKSHFLLPGRAYQYLPTIVIKVVDLFEIVLPNFMMGVSYWKVRKSQ